MTKQNAQAARIEAALRTRFGEDVAIDPAWPGLDELERLAGHRSHRRYADKAIDDALLDALIACALSAPSKSDLQQADIVEVRDPAKRKAIAELIPSMPWVREAPVFLVFCGNGRLVREIARLRDKPFPNDHLDAFFNAAVDSALVLAYFLRAAAAVGLGCCPISVIRNHAQEVSDLLELPDLVFPLSGLCVGYPAGEGRISPRLPLGLTRHVDRYDEGDLDAALEAYDRRRDTIKPLTDQREPDRFGTVPFYGWSEDKARQYANPQREDFGAFVRGKGFDLT